MKTTVSYPFALLLLIVSFTSLPFATNANIKGIAFKIDIGTFEEKIDEATLFGFSYIIVEKEEGFAYKVGEYKDFIRAQRARNTLITRGYNSSEIEAYFNQREIKVDDALTLLENRNKFDGEAGTGISITTLNSMLDASSSKHLFFTIQVGLYSTQKVDAFFHLPKAVEERVTEIGQYRYTYGEYTSLAAAEQAQELISGYGINDAFVIAYDNGKRISMSLAKEKIKEKTSSGGR